MGWGRVAVSVPYRIRYFELGAEEYEIVQLRSGKIETTSYIRISYLLYFSSLSLSNSMNTPNSTLVKQAKDLLSGRWGQAVLVFLLFIVLSAASQFAFRDNVGLQLVFQLAVGAVFPLGLAVIGLAYARQQEVRIEMLFEGFKHLLPSLLAYLIITIITLLGVLLFIVPGVILSIGLSMTFFIMADDRSISAVDAVKKSWEMMNGYKMKLFKIQLRMIGLGLLCILTLGIGFFFLLPYYYTLMALFYDDIQPERMPLE